MKNLNEVEKSIKGAVENLVSSLNAGKSERYIEYLKFCSKFYNYSQNNQILIYTQMPTATRVAGFKAWESLGFKINRGSKALKILAPQQYKYIEVDGERIYFNQMTKEQKANKAFHKVGVTYKPVPVFDISQCTNTNNEDVITSFFYNLGDTHKDQYINLSNLVSERLNINIIQTEKTQGAEGVSMGGTILIKSSIDYNNKLLTLLHEVAHEMLDKGEESDRSETTKEIRELRAESVSYIVGQYLGLENPFSSDYLLMYKADAKSLKEHLEKIQKTSKSIIELLNIEESKNVVA